MAIGISNFMAIQRKPNLIGFGLLNAGSDLTWILGVSGGTGGSSLTYVDLTGQIDGVRTSFALGGPPSSQNNTEVYLNGVALKPVAEYTVSGSNLVMAVAPVVGDIFYARYPS